MRLIPHTSLQSLACLALFRSLTSHFCHELLPTVFSPCQKSPTGQGPLQRWAAGTGGHRADYVARPMVSTPASREPCGVGSLGSFSLQRSKMRHRGFSNMPGVKGLKQRPGFQTQGPLWPLTTLSLRRHLCQVGKASLSSLLAFFSPPCSVRPLPLVLLLSPLAALSPMPWRLLCSLLLKW